MSETLHVGFAKVDITPELPCTMIGYGKNGRTATSVLDPIHGKSLSFDGFSLLVFDVLFIPQYDSSHIMSATHNHSAPEFQWTMRDNLICQKEKYDKCSLFLAQTICNLNINRRRWTWRGVKTRPNPYAFRDNILTYLKICRDNNPPIYVINYACHAGMWHGNSVSADWPGRIKIDDAEIVFLQGFSGDLIPDNRSGRNFKARNITEKDMDHAGEQVAEAVRKSEYRLRPCGSIFNVLNLVP